jgi:hypothetical protein
MLNSDWLLAEGVFIKIMEKINRNVSLTKDLIVWLESNAQKKEISLSAFLRMILREKQEADKGRVAA